MKAQDSEREALKHRFNYRQQKRLAQPSAGGHDLELRDAVHRIDVVEPFYAVLIALVHAVNADEAGAAFRCRRTAHPNGYVIAVGLRPVSPPGFIALCPAQIVQMRHRNPRQTFIAGVFEERHRPLHEALRGRSRQCAMQRVGLGQERHVGGRERASKTGLGRGIALGQNLTPQRAAYQTCQVLS